MMKKCFGLLVLLGILFGCSNPERDVYMFSYFQKGGTDGLHLAYSLDGYNWEALKDNKSFLTPAVGEDKLMRDPCIIRGPEGKFHMVWTVSWNERGIGYAWSEDLINWSEQKFLPVMEQEPTAMNCWAPELYYDDLSKQYMIYWSTTIPERFPETANLAEDEWNHRAYYTTTKNFEELAPAQLLYDQGFNVIDAVITKEGEEYIMIVKDETKFPVAQKDLHIAKSTSLTSGYSSASQAITDHWVEGPTIAKVDEKWIIYFDRYRDHNMGAIASNNLEDWVDISDEVSFPDGTRHGTIFKITAKELDVLKQVRVED